MRNFQPVFIIGFPRSGTTLLLRILKACEDFPSYRFDETHFFSHYFKRYGSLKNRKNLEKFVDDLTSSDWFRVSEIDKDLYIKRCSCEPAGYSVFLRIFMETIASRQNKYRWVEKTPWHILYVKEIAADFPTAKFIHIIRDPRDVVVSVCRAGWKPASKRGQMSVAAAWGWHIRYAQKCLSGLDGKSLALRYEDLICAPERESARIRRFLDVNLDIEAIEGRRNAIPGTSNSSFGQKFEGISKAPVGRWEKNLHPRISGMIDYMIGHDLMSSLGYQTSGFLETSLLSKLELKGWKHCYNVQKTVRLWLFPIIRK